MEVPLSTNTASSVHCATLSNESASEAEVEAHTCDPSMQEMGYTGTFRVGWTI